MVILGVHAGHDCGAALICNNKIAVALNEERLSRNKMSFGVPWRSIPKVLEIAGMSPADVDEIAFETISAKQFLIPHARPFFIKGFTTKGMGFLDFFYIKGKRLVFVKGFKAVVLSLIAATGVPRWFFTDVLGYLFLRWLFGLRKKITFISHHESHAGSAYFTGDMPETLSVVCEDYDGRDSMAIDLFRQGKMISLAKSRYPNSAGLFYALITRLCGYNHFLHCGKITGLAAYGDPKKAYSLVEKLFWAEGMELRASSQIFRLGVEYSKTGKIPNYFENHSVADLAAAFQARLEDVIVSVVQKALVQTNAKHVALSGGVMANVRLNQSIFEIPGVEEIFIHPGMSDCGVAAGAALALNSRRNGGKPYRLSDVFLGYEISDSEIERELNKRKMKYSKESNIARTIAHLLQQKKVVVRVRGKMEYGPRALGNRSILYHCDDPSINKWLNARLQRTEFMPFAPAILAEHAPRCFQKYRGAEYAAEFMTITFQCTPWMKETCPAVVHVDNTARPQFVTRQSNADFHGILAEYYKLTGIPVLINTSYNIHNEPIVMTASDAIRVFEQTCLDYIALNNYLVSSKENGLVWDENKMAILS
ncbi:MAG: hypothetical protein HY537_16690 [Deltaproteobacteria bacterium]|nr:hypothetical protein [Deltaproteobacteria bacterium]